ncbi:cullin-3-like [Rhopalosiphum padi]|uniref:cullin-3-like n=1 Tax=Rhopalosiphum padi TaxID=40932 RepID=UPI00298E1C40|nr:cullin-3-like [Rhopalosiphum padi]
MESIHSGHNKLEHFDKLGLILFRCMIFQDVEVQNRMIQSLSEMKRVTIRDSILLSSDRFLLEDFSKMCAVLKMDSFFNGYAKSLFLRLTTKFFQYLQSLSEDYLFQYCTCSYFKNADAKITEEMDRIQFHLDTTIVTEIYDIIKTELVIKNMKTILEMKNCGVVYMLKNNQDEDLKWIYYFLCSVNDGVKVMFECMCPYFREIGTTVVLEKKGNSDAINCIQSLLDLKDKFDNLMINLFNNDRLFDEIVGSEFGFFLKFNSLIPKFLSIFIDFKLRRERPMYIRNFTKVEMNKVVFLIRHLQDKSNFEKFYRIHLAERLLSYRNVNMNVENRVIMKLKRAYVNGYGYSNSLFTSRIEGMSKDKFELSKPIIYKYKEYVFVNKCILGTLQPFDLNVEVINSIYWPVTYPKSMCRVPSIALSAFNDFKTFYSKREGRKTLKLLPQFGTVELDAIFYDVPKSNKRSCDGEYSTTNNQCCVERKYRVMVTTYQMCVLDMFNTYDFLTYERILKETMIPKKSLLNALHGLVQFHHLLLKFPNCREIKSNDRFSINEFFRIK